MKNIKNIVLDYGHGGVDKKGNYTTAPKKMKKFTNGEVAYEGVLNREIGSRLHRKLSGTKLNVVTTVAANDSRDMPLRERVKVANSFKKNETLLVSIHSNAFNGKARGFELYTTKGITTSDVLAEEMAIEVEKVYKELQLKLRFDVSDGDKDKEADFHVLINSKCPAVLIECLFFDNYEDFKMLKDVYFQERLAIALYKGIMNYVNKNI